MKWIYDIGGCGDVAPIIYDMNMDGVLDVVINGSCNPTIFCLNGATGELIWSQPSGGGDSPPTVADMDNDGKPEVLFGNFNGEIRVLNGEDGSTAKVIQVIPEQRALQSEPTLVDVDNDGDLDILAASYFNFTGLYVWAFDYDTGAIIWENHQEDAESEFHAYHGGAVADIDNDGLDEYVIGSWGGFIHALNVEDGSELWRIEVPVNNFMAISIADLDNDKQLEVIFSNNDYETFDDRIWVVSGLDGTEEWSYPVNFSAFRGVSISDINGNGQLDLISGHFMGMVRVIEPYNGLIWELNLRDFFPDDLPYFEAEGQALVADFDQNGTADIFISGGYGTYTPDEQNTGSAFMIEAGEGGCPEWLMFRHDVRRTGYLPPEEVEAACQATATQAGTAAELDFSVFPNPAAATINFSYRLPSSGQVEIGLTDITGRAVATVFQGQQTEGQQQLTFENKNQLPAGAYLCRFQLNGEVLFYKKVFFQ